jgi:hypothetical protein
MAEGWDGIELADKKPIDEQEDLDILYKRTFTSEEGKRVLEHLKNKTIEQPTWVPGSGHELAYAREGQNSVVKDIIRRIERAKK